MRASISKVAYKPVGIALGIASGMVSGLLFRQAWKMVFGESEAPSAMDEHRGWGEILAAAALQGAIFAVIRAVVDRGGAVGMRWLTGRWPD